jgi:hypothetical protein
MTAAAWVSGSPMEVPAMRGITAISVVGILGQGVGVGGDQKMVATRIALASSRSGRMIGMSLDEIKCSPNTMPGVDKGK